MGEFAQHIDLERINALSPIESIYPDLAVERGFSGTTEAGEDDVSPRIMYWYHPDYVGNVDLVTDANQQAHEMSLYNPWGESLYHWESATSNWSSPYRFNSKELDSETGMHYYGARYHHPKLSVWMSVDPLAHQTLESYQYTGNNAIMLVDPEGRRSGWVEHTPTGKMIWAPNINSTEEFAQSGYVIGQFTYAGQVAQRVKRTDNGTNYVEYYGENGSTSTHQYPAWVASAYQDIGLHEVENKDEVARYTTYPDLNAGGPSTFPNGIGGNRPWCACFVNYHLEESGYPGPFENPAAVENWNGTWRIWKAGVQIDAPVFGAIVTIGDRHIGIVVGMSGDNILILGGNQDDRVSVMVKSVEEDFKFYLPENYTPAPLDSDKQHLQTTNTQPTENAGSLQ